MNSRTYCAAVVLMIGTILAPCPKASALTLPKLDQELRPLVDVETPTLEDAKQAISALSAKAAGATSAKKSEFDTLIKDIKAPFVAEATFTTQRANIPKLEKDVESATQAQDAVRRNPPRDINGQVNNNFWQLLDKQAGDKILAAQSALKNASGASLQLSKELANTNSAITGYLRAGRLDIALALASSMFAVQSRHNVRLNVDPAMSWVWVMMRKLDVTRRKIEQERARKQLIRWAALNLNARNKAQFGAAVVPFLKDTTELGTILGAGELIEEGMAEERRTELMIAICLEIIFFQPEPTMDGKNIQLVMQNLLTGNETGPKGAERFSKAQIQKALADVDPGLAANTSVVETMAFILKSASEQSGGGGGAPEQGPSGQRGTAESPKKKDATGTGFFITKDGYIATNNHVVADCTHIEVRIGSEPDIVAKVVATDPNGDLAILKIPGEHPCLGIAPVRGVKLGATVATVGFPVPFVQGYLPKMAKGEIAGLAGIQDDPARFQISVPIQHGNSGGALVDVRGNAVGVIVSIMGTRAMTALSGDAPNSIAYAIKSSLLMNLIDSVTGVSENLAPLNTQDRPFEDMIDTVKHATVLIHSWD